MPVRRILGSAVLATAAVLLGACSSSAATSRGAELFAESFHNGVRGCVSCHTVSDRPSVGGPSLVAIGSTAADRVPGVEAADYLRESILAPGAHHADGWGEGMPSYAGVLTADEVDAIVDYLLSLR